MTASSEFGTSAWKGGLMVYGLTFSSAEGGADDPVWLSEEMLTEGILSGQLTAGIFAGRKTAPRNVADWPERFRSLGKVEGL